MDKRLSWTHVATPYENKSSTVTLLILSCPDQIILSSGIVGEIEYRQNYEELPPAYCAYVTDPLDKTQKKFLGKFDTLQTAKDTVVLEIEKLLKCDI